MGDKHHYGKRFAAPEQISVEELMRLKREVTDTIMTDAWYLEMVEKDQDDSSKSTAIFDFAALAGKFWKAGGYGCDFFARCDTPTSDILAMIENELEDFRQLEESFLNEAGRAESAMEEEKSEVEEMINSL